RPADRGLWFKNSSVRPASLVSSGASLRPGLARPQIPGASCDSKVATDTYYAGTITFPVASSNMKCPKTADPRCAIRGSPDLQGDQTLELPNILRLSQHSC